MDHADTNVLNTICEILAPFKIVTEHMSKDQPMAALMIPFQWSLQDAVKPKDCDSKLLEQFKTTLTQDLGSR